MFTRFQAGPDTLVIEQSGPSMPVPPDAPGALFLAALGGAYQRETAERRQYLLDCAAQLRDYIAAHFDRLQYRYTIEYCIMGRPELKMSGAGGASGFKIDGVSHAIHGGVGECVLTRYEPLPDGSGTVQQRIDVSDRRRVETDDWGEIRIRRRKVKYTLPEILPDVIAFLERVEEREVRLLSYDKPPGLRDLLQAFSEGGGGDDWAIEELGRQGATGRAQLMDALENGRLRKYVPAIVQLLLLLHGDEQTYETLHRFLDAQPEGREKSQVATLIAAYRQATDQGTGSEGKTI